MIVVMSDDSPKNVISLAGKPTEEPPVERVLADAVAHYDAGLIDEIVIVGLSGDDDIYFMHSAFNRPDVLWLLEVGKHELIQVTDEDYE